MRLPDLFFAEEIMPEHEFRPLAASVLDYEIARLDFEEAVELAVEAQEKMIGAEAAVTLKKIQYGIGD